MQTIIGAGQSADGIVVNSGDLVAVNDTNGSSTYGYYGGPKGGMVTHTIVKGGELYLSYGSADQTTTSGDGEIVIDAGGLATDTTLNGGRLVLYNSQAEADNTTINDGGRINGTGNTHHTVINNGGVYTLDSNDPTAVHDDITVYGGGTVDIQNTQATYSGLKLNAGGSVLTPVPYNVNTAAYDPISGNLNLTYQYQAGNNQPLTTMTGTYSLHLDGNYSTTNFVLSDGTSDRLLVTAQKTCFCRGTKIRTTDGEVRIELLQVGDKVLTLSGRSRTIRWIGSSAALVSEANRPVLVQAGAFHDNSPTRNLRVTRGHSFLLGDVLIPIGKLINGSSICWDLSARTVEVFHIELDVHDIVYAEGALAESYRDDGNRDGFSAIQGRGETLMAMPTFAPVVSSGPIVDRAKSALNARSQLHAMQVSDHSPIVRGNDCVRSSIS